MKLTEAEFKAVGAQGLFITEKCDGCGRILNQSYRYTIAGRSEVYCTAICRDKAILGAKLERVIKSERCFRCHAHKGSGSGPYCDRCGPFADPHGKKAEVAEAELPCKFCGRPVPVLRRASGATICSDKCRERSKKQRQRNRVLKTTPSHLGASADY